MLRREIFGRRNKNYKIKWRIPDEDGWKKVAVEKVPTHFLLQLLKTFDKKGYSKIRGLMDNDDAWMLKYITELETELDKRNDVDEYI